jgi:hypothetical protein
MSTTDSGKTDSTTLLEIERIYNSLRVIHSAAIICREVSKSSDFEQGPELSRTIQHSIVLPLDTHMQALESLIEEMGGNAEVKE